MTVQIKTGLPNGMMQVTTRSAFDSYKYTFAPVHGREDTYAPVEGCEPTRTVFDALKNTEHNILSQDDIDGYVNAGGLQVPHVRCAYVGNPGVIRVSPAMSPETFDGAFVETIEPTGNEQYAFAKTDDGITYVGDSINNSRPKSHGDVPEKVIEAVEEAGYNVSVPDEE